MDGDYNWLLDLFGGNDPGYDYTGPDDRWWPTDDYTGSYPSTGPLTQGDLGYPTQTGDGGDNIDQGGGFNPGGGGGFSLPDSITSILKSLGLTQPGGSGGGLDSLLPILTLLGFLGNGFNASNATKEAGAKLEAGANKANDIASGLIGGARTNFNPYMDTGKAVLPQIAQIANTPGPQYGPIASHAFSPIKGVSTIADLAKR